MKRRKVKKISAVVKGLNKKEGSGTEENESEGNKKKTENEKNMK